MSGSDSLARVGQVLKKYEGANENFVVLLRKVKVALETSVLDRVDALRIRPYPGQPREYFNESKIFQLSDSIDMTAQIQPGMLRRLPLGERNHGIDLEIVDGERRWRAVMLIPAERRPLYKCEIIEADDEVVQFLIAGMANFNREGHQVLETADTIKRYRDFDIPMEAVADLLGISTPWAYALYSLLKLPREVQDMLKPKKVEGKADARPQLQITAAVAIAKAQDPIIQRDLAYRVINGQISLSGLRKAVIQSAESLNIQIRARSDMPDRRWDRRSTKLSGLDRFTEALEMLADDEAVLKLARGRPREVAVFREELERIRTRLLKVVTAFNQGS